MPEITIALAELHLIKMLLLHSHGYTSRIFKEAKTAPKFSSKKLQRTESGRNNFGVGKKKKTKRF